MEQLINIEDIKSLKDIGKKPDVDKISPIIAHAHDDLREYLGTNFFFDVIAHKEESIYQELLSGGTFTVSGQFPEIQFYQAGLKAMLIDLFMARYIAQLNTNITPFGVTVKQSDSSEPVDRATLQDRVKEQLQMAGSKWELIKMYLTEKATAFPVYISCSNTIASGERKMRLRRLV